MSFESSSVPTHHLCSVLVLVECCVNSEMVGDHPTPPAPTKLCCVHHRHGNYQRILTNAQPSTPPPRLGLDLDPMIIAAAAWLPPCKGDRESLNRHAPCEVAEILGLRICFLPMDQLQAVTPLCSACSTKKGFFLEENRLEAALNVFELVQLETERAPDKLQKCLHS